MTSAPQNEPGGKPAPSGVTPDRLRFLDGLRGWGALVVVLYHVFVEVVPVTKESSAMLRHVFLFNGTLAVWIFFVVSGFSLSIGYLRTRDLQLLKRQAYARYLRLALPILAFALLYFAAFQSGLIPPPASRPEPFQAAMQSGASLLYTLRFSAFDVFFDYDSGATPIPPLWTMPSELIGSFLVLAMCALAGQVRGRWIGYAAVFAVLILLNIRYLPAFVVGLAAADIYASGYHRRIEGLWWLAALFAIAAAAGAWLLPGRPDPWWLLVASVLFLSVMCWPAARNFLESPVSRFLGRISFPLYLVHVLVLWTFSLHAFAQLKVAPDDALSIAGIGVATVVVSIVLAFCLVFIDAVSIRISQAFARLIVSARPPEPRNAPQASSP